jgi:hypothetical protein
MTQKQTGPQKVLQEMCQLIGNAVLAAAELGKV